MEKVIQFGERSEALEKLIYDYDKTMGSFVSKVSKSKCQNCHNTKDTFKGLCETCYNQFVKDSWSNKHKWKYWKQVLIVDNNNTLYLEGFDK